MNITPRGPNIPGVIFSTTVNGRLTSGNIVLPEAFVINGQGVHMPLVGNQYPGAGNWSEEEDGALVYKCLIGDNPAIWYETLIVPRGDKIIECAITVRNFSGITFDLWSMANAHVAFDQPGLQDTDGARTFVVDNVSGGLGLAAINTMLTIPQTGPYAGQWGLWYENPTQLEAQNVHWPLVARKSADGTQWVGVAADTCSTVGGNMNQGCIHVNPKIGTLPPSGPGSVRSHRLRILLDEPTGGNILTKGTLALYS